MCYSILSTSVIAAALLLGFGRSGLAAEVDRRADKSPAGLMIEEIELQTDMKERLALLDKFLVQYPTHPSAAWVCNQIRFQALQTERWDRVEEMSKRLLEIDAEDPLSALYLLQTAERSGDPEKLRKSLETAEAVAEVAVASRPGKNQPADATRKRVEIARKTAAYAEAVRLRLLLSEREPAQLLPLLEGFEKRYPKSALSERLPLYRAHTAWAAGEPARAAEAARQVLQRDARNEDALFLLTVAQLQTKEDPTELAGKLMAASLAAEKPACLSFTDWNRKRDAYLATAQAAFGLAAGIRHDYALARRTFAAAAAYADDNADFKSALQPALAADKDSDLGSVAKAFGTPRILGPDLQSSLKGCLSPDAKLVQRSSAN